MLEKQIIINTNDSETRVAVMEREHVAELFIERTHNRGLMGNIYKAKVSRVLPGMQAAFIDIGEDKAGFLYISDVVNDELIRLSQEMFATSTEDISFDEIEKRTRWKKSPIEKILRDGQDIYVQVIKEPFNTKGPRLSMFITFPGRYLVLAPNFNHIGISKKITDESERNRLREVVNQIKPNDVSVIVRTAAVNVPSEVIENDLKYLLALWGQAKGIGQKSSAPYLIHQDIDIIQRITRDHYSEDVHKIIIDSKSAFGRLANFLSVSIPAAESKLELYEGDTPIFDIYGIELDIAKALNRKVELPSGGYIIVDQTEALTTFDINTGSYVGRQNARDTVLKTNKEALKRIAEQIRLRNIGGLIVIDFIDMDDAADREQIFLELQAELKNDRAKTSILKISELGLLQMTRKRTSESLEHVLLESCPHCQGRGKIRSTVTEAHDLLREVVRLHTQTKKTLLTVRVRDDIRDWILEEETDWLQDIIDQYGITVNFRANSMTLANMQETSYEISAE